MPARAQFIQSLPRDLFERALASRRQGHEHPPAIFFAPVSVDISVRLEPVDQFNGAVMSEKETLRKPPDGGFLATIQAADGQKHLVLLRLEAGRTRLLVAGTEKFTNAITELRQCGVFALMYNLSHPFILSYHDIKEHTRSVREPNS